MCLCINYDNFMHIKCYFFLNYRTLNCDDGDCNYFRSLKSNKTAHKILIATQKFKKMQKKHKFVRFSKEIFDENNFGQVLTLF